MQVIQDSLAALTLGAPQAYRNLAFFPLLALETSCETEGKCALPPSAVEVGRFLARMQAAASERFAALGEGEDIRLSGEGVAGGALAAGGRVVHLAGFAVPS